MLWNADCVFGGLRGGIYSLVGRISGAVQWLRRNTKLGNILHITCFHKLNKYCMRLVWLNSVGLGAIRTEVLAAHM